jgi:hypothetical protein
MYFVTRLANAPSLMLFTPDIGLRRAATATTGHRAGRGRRPGSVANLASNLKQTEQ